MEVKDPFAFDKCCFNEATLMHSQIADYYEAVRPFMDSITEDIFQAEMYGKETESLYNKGNDFHYLMVMLLMISDERKNDVNWDALYGTGCGIDKGSQYYIDKYNIDCIQKHFYCSGNGNDISKALNIFSMNPDFVDQDGIGFMYIDYAIDKNCASGFKPFQVK